ncbi:MAG: chromate transporter [Vulcanimicrobiota bacterium]
MSDRPSLGAIFLAFTRISLLSVGGATMAWIREETVRKRGWLSEDEFAQAVAVCQLMPGANTLNMAVFLGAEMRGWPGALAAMLGLIGLPFFIVLALGLAYGRLQQGPLLRATFGGLGAGAAGVAFGTALQMARKHLRDGWLIFLALLVFASLAGLRLHMLAVVALVLGLSLLFDRSQA